MGCCQSTRPADRPTANVEADSDQDQYLYAFILPFAYSDPSSVIVKVGHTIQPAQRFQQHKNNLGKIPIQCHFPDFGFPCSCREQCSSEEGHCIKVCKENESILFLVNTNLNAERDIERLERCVRALTGSPIMNDALGVFDERLTNEQRRKCNETEWVVSRRRTCQAIQREFRAGNFDNISPDSNLGEQFLSGLGKATGHANVRVVCQQERGVEFIANAYIVPE